MRGAAAGFGVAACAGAACAAWAAAAEEVRAPHGVAVIIGNGAYEERGLADVDYALRDARAFERYVRGVLGFGGKRVVVLENATERDMRDALGDPRDPAERRVGTLWALLDSEDRSDVVVFYSGHGAPGVEDRQGYLLPVDVRARDAQKDGYPIAELYETLGALRRASGRSARSVRVYLDACFSGQTAGGQLFRGASPAFPVAALPEGVEEGMTVLTAAGADQLAHWDDDARHGMFTHHLLDALYGGADRDDDGEVTAGEARFYLDNVMTPEVVLEYRTRQEARLLPPLAGPDDPGAVLSAAPPGGFPERPEIEGVSGETVTDPNPDPPPDEEELDVASGGDAAGSDPPPDPGAAEEKALELDLADRKAVQRGLESLVGSVGRVDGLFGRLTRTALRSWQEGRGVPATGYLTRAQADALIAEGREAAARAQAAAEADRAAREKAEREKAERERDDGAFASARSANTVAAFEAYLASFPSGRHARDARRLRDELKDPPVEVGDVIEDCGHCPEMMVVPARSFTMGSPSSESGRDGDEGPQRRVTIGSEFAVGVHEVTRGEFARFVSATGRSMGDSCWTYENGEWEKRSGRNWRSPGFSQSDSHPVVCVSWDDARAYASWLSRETGESYRLLSEAEWEYVARAGTTTRFWWGDDIGRNRANCGSDLCGDSHARTAPVGSFGANGFGLHDVHGNVWEWVEDCWHDDYTSAPRDGRAWLGNNGGDCSRRVLRGGSWSDQPENLRSALRVRDDTGRRDNDGGFRLLRSVRTFTP